jgi:hypothetical protein
LRTRKDSEFREEMAMRFLTLEEGEELRRLRAELPEAYLRVVAVLSEPFAYQRTAEGRARLAEAEAAEAAIVRRIKDLQKPVVQPWYV